MSYILEALKKAEAERHGGTLQTSVPPAFSSSASHRPHPVSRLAWLAVPVIAIGAATAWWAMTQDERPAATVALAPASPALALPPPPDVNSTPAEEPAKSTPKPREKPVEKPAPKKAPDTPAVARTERKKEAPPEQQVLTLRQLPDHIQREIPPLTIGGYIYSGNKADRSVLINKRLLREGDEVAPGLTLESMQPNGMILAYKGYRYRSGY